MSWHAKQSSHNHDVQRILSGHPLCRDWEITALFYSLIHVIDGYMISVGAEPQDHRRRKRLVRQNLPHVYEDYDRFYNLCLRARYLALFDRITEGERRHAVELHRSICARVQSEMR